MEPQIAWAIAVIVVGVTLCLSLRDVFKAQLAATGRSEQQSRVEGWAAYEPLNITETVATVAAAAVAVRHMKFLDEENANHARRREVILDFADLRRIVRRMTASIRSGEAKACVAGALPGSIARTGRTISNTTCYPALGQLSNCTWTTSSC